MRVLYVTPFLPRSDAPHGGARAMAHLITAMARRHDVALVSLKGSDEPDLESSLRALLGQVDVVHRPTDSGPLRKRITRGIRLLSAPFRGRPRWAVAFDVPALRRRLRQSIADWNPDVVQVEFHVMAQYADEPLSTGTPVVIVEHEPGAAAAEDQLQSDDGGPRWWRHLEWKAWERYERSVLQNAPAVVHFTDRDGAALSKFVSRERLHEIPLTIPLPRVGNETGPNEDGNTILFFGNFRHPPNTVAARWLLDAIFPMVRESVPRARLQLVGPDADSNWSAHAENQVEIVGFVEDVAPYVERAAVVVAPIRTGGGTRLKLLESLAHGKAVVATSRALEGIRVEPGEQVLIADDERSFADAVSLLLRRPEERARLGKNARAWAEAHLDVERTADSYEELYRRLLTQAVIPMTATFQISVAISTMDRPEALRACLESLAAGSRLPEEVVVVDQSQGSDSEAVAEQIRSTGLPVIYVRDPGRGLGRSQNLAIQRSRAKYVAVIDDDCVADHEWLAEIESKIAKAPEPDLIAGRVLPLAPAMPGLVPVSTRTSTRRRKFGRLHAPWNVGSGNNFIVRKQSFLSVGGCDERLGPGAAARGGLDMDLFYRMIRSGAVARYEPDIVVFHEQKPPAERMARRPMYGQGMGACFALWARELDPFAPVLLSWWLTWRAARALRAVVEMDVTRAREEMIMIGSTIRGLVQGARLPRRDRSADAAYGE